ncbi:MAG TPA: hypothetical protein VE404_06155 [Verrucomicrobiae bacterium]|nr:hypothetical protein [Verrucomicrobiae bacterium]
MPNRVATVAALCALISAGLPALARAADAGIGPLVVVPECRMIQTGCGLDPATADLNAAACAVAVAKQLERRGIRTTLPGPVPDVCAGDPNAVVALTTLTFDCGVERDDRTRRAYAMKTRLRGELVIRDCASGKVAGRARSARAIESGRRTIVRDLVEELGHHIAPRKVRASHPETPLRWLRADVGGERSVEVNAGAIDTSSSGINRILKGMGLPEQERARHLLVESAYTPWSSPRLRVALGVSSTELRASGDGTFDGSLINLPPSNPQTFTNVPVDVVLRSLGFNLSAAYGFDYLRNQRISAVAHVGYSAMGGTLAPSRMEIDAKSPINIPLRDSAWPLGAGLRWEWRIFPHWEIAATYGWNRMNFKNPKETISGRFAPYDVGYTGAELLLGIAVRY